MTDVKPIRVLIAEDQPMIRKALQTLLEAEPGFDVVKAVADGQEAVRAARAFEPDVVLMDIKMPMLDGVAATRAILSENSAIRIIILTTFDTDDLVFDAIMAGATSYLLKDAEEREIFAAMRSAISGEPRLSPRIAEKILSEFRRVKSSQVVETPFGHDSLTEREKEVLAGVASGKGNREIAQELSLAEGTVKNHVSVILSKLHLRSRTELAVKTLSRR